jgi:hypothetical protein
MAAAFRLRIQIEECVQYLARDIAHCTRSQEVVLFLKFYLDSDSIPTDTHLLQSKLYFQ